MRVVLTLHRRIGDLPRETSWEIIAKGHVLAQSGHTYVDRRGALQALERVTGAQVQMARLTPTGRPEPIALFTTGGDVIPIEHAK